MLLTCVLCPARVCLFVHIDATRQTLQKPKTLDEAVDKLVAVKLDELRQGLAADYAAKATALSGRIGQLEQQQQRAQQAAAAAATASQSNSHSGARVASAKAAPGSRVASAKPAAS